MIEFNKHANVIYNDAGEKNVAAVLLYADVDNNCLLHWDEEFKFPVMTGELEDLFMKGLIIIWANSDTIFRPISFTPAHPAGAKFDTVTYNSTNYISYTPVEE